MNWAAWRDEIGNLRDGGQWFELCDSASRALKSYPDDPEFIYDYAFALVNTGALQIALETISPILENISGKTKPRIAVSEGLHEDLLGLGGRIHKEIWRRTGAEKHLALAKEFYNAGFSETNGIFTGINSASMAWLLGDRSEARELAHKVLRLIKDSNQETYDYWMAATEGEALLLLGEAEKAVESYGLAKTLTQENDHIVSSTRQLKLLSEFGVSVPQEILRLLSLPPVIIFAGHMVDRPGSGVTRFPGSLADAVRREIDNVLDLTGVTAGFGSVACGSDILFIEALKDRNAEVNVVLPFDAADFVETSVRFAGDGWEERFATAVEAADTVTYLTQEKYLNEDQLFSYNNELIAGNALIRAKQLMTEVHLISVVDKQSPKLLGGTVELMEHLSDVAELREIDLGVIRKSAGGSVTPYFPSNDAPRSSEENMPRTDARQMATMLFSDLKGFSRLTDEHFGQFSEFQSLVSNALKISGSTPESVRTIGDAIFAVSCHASLLAEYAITLKNAVKKHLEIFKEFDPPLDVRIALHAAPIYALYDPIADRQDWFGSHVNRTARLEPVTVPGHIYATEQFIAILATEECRASLPTEGVRSQWTWELVGTVELSKNFGEQRVFHLTETGATV